VTRYDRRLLDLLMRRLESLDEVRWRYDQVR
jgi:hypothetical protein